jgi:hypothetical protein
MVPWTGVLRQQQQEDTMGILKTLFEKMPEQGIVVPNKRLAGIFMLVAATAGAGTVKIMHDGEQLTRQDGIIMAQDLMRRQDRLALERSSEKILEQQKELGGKELMLKALTRDNQRCYETLNGASSLNFGARPGASMSL